MEGYHSLNGNVIRGRKTWHRFIQPILCVLVALGTVAGVSYVVTDLNTASPANSGNGSSPSVPSLPSSWTILNEPPREQWMANAGYCGETSLVSAGLFYGQYTSQYDVRELPNMNLPPHIRQHKEVLLGINAAETAAAMHLRATKVSLASNSFLVWVRKNILSGFPVIIGVFENQYLINGITVASAGDPDYDHIVPVTSVYTNVASASSTVYQDDSLAFNDNGIYTGPVNRNPNEYNFTFAFDAFKKSRVEANSPTAPPYSLKSGLNYGLVVLGVADPLGETFPVRVQTNKNYESPVMQDRSSQRPAAMALVLTVTVSGLTPGVNYTLYRYNTFDVVPTSNFKANAAVASKSWPVFVETGSCWMMQESIISSDMAIYRAVAA